MNSFAGSAKLEHFDVKIPFVPADSKANDVRRIYYCDFLATAQQAPPVNPIPQDERTIEVEAICSWIANAVPKSRFDAYPLLLFVRDVLRRLISSDLCIIDKDAKARRNEIDQLKTEKQELARKLDAAEDALGKLRQQGQLLEETTAEMEKWKASAISSEVARKALQDTVDRLSQQSQTEEAAFTHRLDKKVAETKAMAEMIAQQKVDELTAQLERAKAEAAEARASLERASATQSGGEVAGVSAAQSGGEAQAAARGVEVDAGQALAAT